MPWHTEVQRGAAFNHRLQLGEGTAGAPGPPGPSGGLDAEISIVTHLSPILGTPACHTHRWELPSGEGGTVPSLPL